MGKKIRIAIDAMGGDNSPNKIIEGIKISLKKNKECNFILYGQKDKINKEIEKILGFDKSFISNLTTEGFPDLKTVVKYRKQIKLLSDLINT